MKSVVDSTTTSTIYGTHSVSNINKQKEILCIHLKVVFQTSFILIVNDRGSFCLLFDTLFTIHALISQLHIKNVVAMQKDTRFSSSK